MQLRIIFNTSIERDDYIKRDITDKKQLEGILLKFARNYSLKPVATTKTMVIFKATDKK